MRWWSWTCGVVVALAAGSSVACSGGGGEEPAPTLVVHPEPTPVGGCEAFLEEPAAIPNENAPLDERAVFERALAPGPTRTAILVKFDPQRQAGPSWVVFDGGGVIAREIAPEHSEIMGRLEECARLAATSPEAHEYEVLSTPAPSDYSILIGGEEVAIPSAARVGRLSSDVPQDFRTIARGASRVGIDSEGLVEAYVVEPDEEEFRPVFEALAGLEESEFPEVIARLDELPYSAPPLPVEVPITSLLVGGELVPMPTGADLHSYSPDCEGVEGCFLDPLVVWKGDEAVVFDLTGPRVHATVKAPPEVSLEPFAALLEAAAAAAGGGEVPVRVVQE